MIPKQEKWLLKSHVTIHLIVCSVYGYFLAMVQQYHTIPHQTPLARQLSDHFCVHPSKTTSADIFTIPYCTICSWCYTIFVYQHFYNNNCLYNILLQWSNLSDHHNFRWRIADVDLFPTSGTYNIICGLQDVFVAVLLLFSRKVPAGWYNKCHQEMIPSLLLSAFLAMARCVSFASTDYLNWLLSPTRKFPLPIVHWLLFKKWN